MGGIFSKKAPSSIAEAGDAAEEGTVNEVTKLHYDDVVAGSTGGGSKTVGLSKELIDFGMGDEPCELNETVADSFEIHNKTTRKIKYKFDIIPSDACKITFSPSHGTVDKKKSKKISVKLVLLQQESLNFRVNLRINGGKETLFLNVRAHADQGVYGVDPLSLDSVEDDGFMVPRVLVQMKNYLVDQGALSEEGILRLAGDTERMKIIKAEMNRTKVFEPDGLPDVNTIANLLKVWFRDMPTPIMNALSPEVIFKSSDRDTCLDAYENLPEPQKSLLGWLLNFLGDIAELKESNKMSAQNLAIVVAPNLYEPPGSDPMEGLVMSQKGVQFLHNLLVHEMQERG